MEGQSFSIKDKSGRFSAVGGDQMLEQTINLSLKCSDGVIGHAKHKQYVAQWYLIYHEMMAVKNLHCEYPGVNGSTNSEVPAPTHSACKTGSMQHLYSILPAL